VNSELRRAAYLISAFVEEDLGICTPPSCNASSVFANNDAEPDAGAALAGVTKVTQFEHAITQFVANDARRRRRQNLSGSCNGRNAILWRNDHPRSVGTLLIASILVIAVPTGSWLSLGRDSSARRAANDSAYCSSTPAAQCPTENSSGGTAEQRAANWVLCGRILDRRGNGQG
jgi:hypothetical protein